MVSLWIMDINMLLLWIIGWIILLYYYCSHNLWWISLFSTCCGLNDYSNNKIFEKLNVSGRQPIFELYVANCEGKIFVFVVKRKQERNNTETLFLYQHLCIWAWSSFCFCLYLNNMQTHAAQWAWVQKKEHTPY